MVRSSKFTMTASASTLVLDSRGASDASASTSTVESPLSSPTLPSPPPPPPPPPLQQQQRFYQLKKFSHSTPALQRQVSRFFQ